MTEPGPGEGKEGSSREKVGGEKASKSSKKSSSKKKKDRGSISTEEQGRGGKGGEGDEKNKSKKGRASISADDGPEAEEHAETGGDRGETGGENRAKTRPKKVKDSQTETVKRDKEERGDSTPRSDARPPPKRRRSSKGGEETREEQRDGHNAKPTSKSSSRRRTDEEGTATKNEGDGKEGERKQLNSKSGEHREQDRFEKGKGKSADESNSKPKTKSRAHSPRGSIDLNAQGASTKDDGDKGGKEKDGQERLDRRKDSKSGSSKKTKERRSSKTKDANTGGPESDPVPDAANAAPPVVATGAGGTSSKDKSKRRRSKDKEERRSSKVVDPSSSAGPEPNAVPEAANATVPAVATEEASSKEKPKRRRSKDKKERRSSKVVDPSSSAGPEPNAVPDAANTAAPVVAAKETSTKDKSKGRETKDKKEKDTDGDGSRKKKERRRSSTSRKEKQAHPSKNMEPGESGSLAKEPHDGTPASRSGGEIGDDGSMTTASAAVLIPDSAKLQEGRDNTEVDGKQKSSGVGSSDRTTAAKEVPAVVGAAGSPSSGEPNGATAEPETATSARATDGGPSDPKTTVSSTGGPGGVPSADDVARVAAKRQEENRDAQPSKPPAATARPKQVITSGSGATLPASLLVKEAPPEALLDSTPKAPNAEAPASGDLTDRREEGNSTAEISSTGGPGDVPFADDVARVAAKPQEENRDAQPSKPPPATARPEKVITSGSGATLPASLLVKEAPPEEPLDSTLKAPNAEAPASGDLTERREERDSTNEEIGGVIEQQGAENAKSGGVGGPAAWEGSVSPTPPRARSNPVSRGTPPRRGSRGGNLAICTQQPYPPAGVDGRDGLKPSSPRSRPRELPLVRAKSDASGGGEGAGAGRSGADDEGAEEKVASFSSRRWKASDEYVLDEDRETPRGGVFAKIPGLDQHLIVEPKKINDPPRCRAPKLISGTVRLYDQEEASEAAFRYPECRGAVFRPSYADDGSFKDLPASSPLLSEPPHRLRLERAHGYHGGGFYPSTDTNAYFLGEDHMPKGGGGSGGSRGGGEQNQGFFEVVYPTAALVVMHKFRAREGVEGGGRNGEGEETAGEARNGGGGGGKTMQRFFDGHTDDVTAVAVHPGGVLVASGQVGRNPDVLVWRSTAQCSKGGTVLKKKKAIIATLKGHERKICCLDFSQDGWLLCSVGADCKSTTNIWDWRKRVAVATVQAGPGPIHAFRFNPYQSYGVPSEKPVPGQALHIDDACYCLVSIGVRHSKFWLLTRGLDKGPAKDEIPPVLANAKWTSSQRVQEEREKEVKGRGNLRWIIDGSSARLNGKGSMADFTCVTFIDDSPPLQTWGANNTVVDSLEESDRSSGRVVLGTAAGDLYIFIQRGVRLIPREFAHDVKRGKGGNGIFLDPWWLFGPGHEVTANKRLWDLGAELVDNIPHSKEAANELVLSDKAKERVHALEQKMAVKPLHPAVFEELKRQHDRFSYTGPLTGHEGGVSGLAFNRETGKVVSAGTNGEIVQWQAFFFDPTSSVVSPARTASGAPAAPVPGSTPAPATPLINNSLVGLINERRNRNEEKIQRSLRSRNPSEPTRRRVGNEAPRGDGRVGGVDVFEMDYRTTLGREDEGEISLSGPGPSSRDIDQDQLGPSPSRVDMFGVSGRRDGFESSGSTRGNLERSSSGDPKNRGSSNEHDEEGSLYGGGMGIRFQTGGETGPRVELDVGWSGGRSGDEFGEECGVSRRGGEAAGEGRQSTRQGGGRDHVSPKRSAFLPRGSHGKSLVWSKDGKRLLTGVNTNILLLLEYPGEDRESSSDDQRVEAVSPRGRSVSSQHQHHHHHHAQGSSIGSCCPTTTKPSVRHLVQGHSGSVMALAVFEGMHEYVTAGYDRSVAVWNTASNLPVAWCSNIPSPVSCLACSPDLEEVAVGTVNTNEILFLKVHRRTQAGPAPSAKGEGGTNTATHIEPHSSKQLLPASAWAKRRQPGPNFRWITTSPSWDRCQIVTLDGKDTPHMAAGGAASAGSGSAGGAAAPFKPNSATKMSPVRERARSASLGGMGHAAGASSGGDPSTPPRKSPSRPPTMGAGPGTGNGGGAGCRSGEHSGRRGRRRYSDGGEPQRGMGATCMRYSPSGSHLAIGCKNGSLVIMAVESSPDTDRGGRTSGDDNDGSRHTGPGDSGRPLEGRGTDGGRERSAELSGGIEGQDGEPWSPSSRRRPRERRKVYRRIAHLKGHSSRVLHLDWTVDGRFVHTCGQDYHILHWEVLPPPPHRRDEGAAEEAALNDDGNGGGDDDGEAVAGEFRPRMFKRAFLVRDEQWATWSSTIGWPVQGVFPAYSDNTDVNSVDVCPDRELLAAADDARTIRLLRYPVLRGGARNRSYTAHSSHVMGARFTVGVKPTRLITVGGVDSTVIQWVVEGAPVDDGG